MTTSEFKELLETTKLPVAHLSFPEEEAPMLPFICFLNPEDNNFAADGEVYFSAHEMIVELYLEHRNEETEGIVEKAISYFYYVKNAEYLDDESCWLITYELEV